MNLLTVKHVVKNILAVFYRLFNLFFLPFLKSYYFSKIEKIPRDTQLFFMTRLDLGPCLLQMHHAECWHRERGPACLVVFTTHMSKVVPLAKYVCQDVEVIHFDNWFFKFLFSIFRNEIIQFYTLNRIYAYACCRWPHALYLYDMTFSRSQSYNVSCYVPAYDPVLQTKWPFSSQFLHSYLDVRKFLDFQRPVFVDMINLHYQWLKKKEITEPCLKENDLLGQLGIDNPYVIINLNCKIYRNPAQNLRRINYPERYNAAIDLLISKGYSVVIQGRIEQPLLAPRKGLVDYSKSPFTSPVNDYKIFSTSSFGIFCKTGPEIFCTICDVPVLGLNYAELCCITPNGRCRFFPKHLWDKKKKEFIHWKEMLERPCFFDMGYLSYEKEIEYVDLEEEEIVTAVEEFLDLLPKSRSSWLQYTSMQKQFKQSLHPAHLDLHDVIEVPCEAYLSSKKYL